MTNRGVLIQRNTAQQNTKERTAETHTAWTRLKIIMLSEEKKKVQNKRMWLQLHQILRQAKLIYRGAINTACLGGRGGGRQGPTGGTPEDFLEEQTYVYRQECRLYGIFSS